MIHITLWQNEKEEIIAFEVDGHAGYGEEGWDIVCSAVSALTIAAPVSYTHLDVYKRQILSSGTRKKE